MKHPKRLIVLAMTTSALFALVLSACDSIGAGGSNADSSAPAEVSDISASTSNGRVDLTWSDPSDGDLDHVEISWSPEDGESQPIEADAGTESASVTGLANGTTYTFTVKTVDGNGNTSDGVSVDAVPEADLSTLLSEASTSLTGVRNSSSSLGDLDGDNDLDILITGEDSGLDPVATVYENRGNLSFTDASAGLTPVDSGASAFGDLDDDNDLDIIVIGDDQSGNDTGIVYRNDGSFSFSRPTTYLANASSGSASIGDIDNDDDPDAVITGYDSSASLGNRRIAEVHENKGSYFTDGTTSLTGVNQSSSSLGDLDGDDDLDLVITGNDGNGQKSTVYEHTGGLSFSDTSAGLEGMDNGSSSLGDLDGDGDLDLLLTGRNSQGDEDALVYENEGNFSFSNASAGLTGVRNSASALGDLDGDGDLDMVIAGNTGSALTTTVYENEGSFSFTEATTLTGVETGSISIGDLDGDGDLDVVVTGDGASISTTVYENALF